MRKKTTGVVVDQTKTNQSTEELPKISPNVAVSQTMSFEENYKRAINNLGYKETSPGTVELPDGTEVKLEKGEKILLINGDIQYRWIVSSADEILQGITQFNKDKGFNVVYIKDSVTGNTVDSAEDLYKKTEQIVSVEIVRHNKAGNI